jgi:hypothetical protein
LRTAPPSRPKVSKCREGCASQGGAAAVAVDQALKAAVVPTAVASMDRHPGLRLPTDPSHACHLVRLVADR